MTVLHPSSFLPRLRSSSPKTNTADVKSILARLRVALENTGLDDTERSYVQAWLTRSFTIYDDEEILDEIAELLTMTTQSLQPETNRYGLPYRFDTPLGSEEIIIEESYMQNVHATGFRTWSSAIHLARRMLLDPLQFFGPHKHSETKPIRLLEIGSGTGLAGIAASRALAHLPGRAQVVLSDMDQITLDVLRKNMLSNDVSPDVKSKVHTDIAHLDWTRVDVSTLQPFDVIIGADIVYEPDHADLIYEVVSRLLARRPQSAFHLVLVTRPTHVNDIGLFEERFSGKTSDSGAPSLVFVQRESIEATEDDAYPYGHRYYEIRWKSYPDT